MDRLNGKIEFYYKFDDGHPEVRVTLSPDSNLGDIFVSFEGFLRAAGYHFEGVVDIVNDDIPQENEAVN